jgi:hypothetical protein
VDIRLIDSLESTCNYVAKYIRKPLPTSVLYSTYHLDEVIIALQGRKILHAFGTWSHFRLSAAPSEESWIYVCHGSATPGFLTLVESLALTTAHLLRSASQDYQADVRFSVSEPPALLAAPPPPQSVPIQSHLNYQEHPK